MRRFVRIQTVAATAQKVMTVFWVTSMPPFYTQTDLSSTSLGSWFSGLNFAAAVMRTVCSKSALV